MAGEELLDSGPGPKHRSWLLLPLALALGGALTARAVWDDPAPSPSPSPSAVASPTPSPSPVVLVLDGGNWAAGTGVEDWSYASRLRSVADLPVTVFAVLPVTADGSALSGTVHFTLDETPGSPDEEPEWTLAPTRVPPRGGVGFKVAVATDCRAPQAAVALRVTYRIGDRTDDVVVTPDDGDRLSALAQNSCDV